MKLCRYGDPGAEKPGLIDADGNIRDLSPHVNDIAGETLSDAGLARLRALDVNALSIVKTNPRYGPCVGGTGKFMCIGLNYSDHAAETGAEPPEHPILFMKATSAIVGPDDDILIPRGSVHTDWEVELGVVIGTACKYVSEAEALDHVAGYCVINDISERRFQTAISGQWTKGKSCDTFGPTGPWLVTRDEIPDPQALDMWLDVNGQRKQTGNTRTMIFTVAQIIAHMSQLMTLHPGDIISTGTPPGVAFAGGLSGEGYLRDGDRMQVWIEGLGQQTQTARDEA